LHAIRGQPGMGLKAETSGLDRRINAHQSMGFREGFYCKDVEPAKVHFLSDNNCRVSRLAGGDIGLGGTT
jgi:hypothetical protein